LVLENIRLHHKLAPIQEMFCPFSHPKWKVSEKLSSLCLKFLVMKGILLLQKSPKKKQKGERKITERQQDESLSLNIRVDRENSHTENSLSAYAIYHVHYEKHNMHM
jgi:hypothetical protein